MGGATVLGCGAWPSIGLHSRDGKRSVLCDEQQRCWTRFAELQRRLDCQPGVSLCVCFCPPVSLLSVSLFLCLSVGVRVPVPVSNPVCVRARARVCVCVCVGARHVRGRAPQARN